MMNTKAIYHLFTILVIFSLACNAVTGLPAGGTPQEETAPDGFSAQVDGFSAESNAEGSVLLK